jgi:hypothetical protein
MGDEKNEKMAVIVMNAAVGQHGSCLHTRRIFHSLGA